VHRAPPAAPADPSRSPEELAKAWLLRVIERTPLAEVGEVELDLLTTEAAPLIDGILRGLSGPADYALELPAEAKERALELGRLRRGERAPAEISRDLATLQSLLIESLGGEGPEQPTGDFARSVERLAEIFGSIQGAVAEGLVRERAGGAPRDELTGLPADAELHEWLQVLIAEYRRYGHPFAVALLAIDGTSRINEAYGRQSADRMLAAVANVIRRQIRTVDQAFRLGDDEFCVLAPHGDAEQLRRMAHRLSDVVEASQSNDDPRIAISAGISACPQHGDEGARLLEVAEEALYAAKAAGASVGVADSLSLPDRS
jgi:diguanylate cyclase (GGDEF)-like protein